MSINFLSVPSVDVDRVDAEFADHMDPNRIIVRLGPASAQIDVGMARQLSAALDRAIVEAAEAEAEAKQDRIAWQSGDDDQHQAEDAATFDEFAAAFDAAAPTAPVHCGAQVHKGCQCIRLHGHDGPHNCAYDDDVIRAEVSEA